MATVVLSSGGFGRRWWRPRGCLPTWRRRFRDGLRQDAEGSEFIAEVKKRRYDLEPVSWEEMQSLAKEVTSQPPDVVERVKRILEN